MNHSGQPAEAEASSWRGLLRWPPFWFFIFLVLAASAISYATFRQNKADTLHKELSRLSTLADSKMAEIAKWRKEREGDAAVFSRSPFFVQAMERWLQRGAPYDADRHNLIDRSKLMQGSYGYQSIALFDAQGKLVLTTPPDAALPGEHSMKLIKQSIQTQSIQFIDIGASDISDSMDVIAPILADYGGKPKTVGVAYLRTDKSELLYLLQAPLSDYKSTELVLVRREGGDVLFLNVFVADNKGVGLLRQPLNQSKLPAAMAISEKQTEVEGVDYQGTPVFAALRKVPGSEWYLVVKVEQEEVYAPLRRQTWLVTGAIAILIILTGMAVTLWWRNQRARSIITKQRQYRILIQTSFDGFWANDFSGRIVDVNEALCQMLGYAREELLLMSIQDIEISETPEETAAHIQKIIQTGGDRFQTRHRRKGGAVINVEVSVQYNVEMGERFFAFFRDITDSKRAENEMREKEERLALATVHNGVGVWDWNLVTQEMIWDDSMFSLYHIRREDFIGTEEAWRAALHPDDLHRGDQEVNDAISGIRPFNTEFRVIWPNGEIRHIKAVAKVFRDESGTPLRMLGINMDITVVKRANEEILRLNAELEQRVAERTASLEAANKELESFSYSVSHDLRVPLRAIDGFSRLVLTQYEEKLDNEGKRLLNVVRDNTKRMGQLIDDILAFSRAGRLEIKTSETDMEVLAREVWQELEPLMAGRDVHIDIKPLPRVQGDPAMLRQVWANLMGNAAKFTNSRATARIEIGGSVAGNECTFYVKDNGVGFDQQYVHKLFGVFQRLHGVDEFEGTGIGLAIVKRIIVRHNGRVRAEGKVNEGATFYFALPVLEEKR